MSLLNKVKDFKNNLFNKYGKNKTYLLVFVVCVLIVYKVFSLGGLGLFEKKYEIEVNKDDQKIEKNGIENEASDSLADNNNVNELNNKNNNKKITVYLTGAVANPGVITIESEKRLDDAIKLLGGLCKDADVERINLAMKLEDSQHYIIPYKWQAEKNNNDDENNEISANNSLNQNYSTNNMDRSSGGADGTKVDINSSKESELIDIPGVGPATAKKIIDYRNEKGKFSKIEDIKNVSGIGEKKFENMKKYIIAK